MKFALIFFVSAVLFSVEAQTYSREALDGNRINPSRQFKTIKTRHFEIHFPSHLLGIAKRVEPLVEVVYNNIRQAFNYDLNEVTHIVLSDKSDQPSLFSIGYPHRQIYLDVTPPPQFMGINEYGEWYEWVLTHEFTHIYQMGYVNGLYSKMSPIFLSTVQPSMAVPEWYREGLAVWLESKKTKRGRLEGSYYRMILRQAVYDGSLENPNFISLNNINSSSIKTWPWTHRAYLFGTYLVEKMNSEDNAAFRLLEFYSKEWPFQFEKAFEKIMKTSLSEFWNELLGELDLKFRQEITEITREPVTTVYSLTNSGFQKNGLQLSQSENWVITTTVNPNEESKFQFIQTDSAALQSKENFKDLELFRSSGSELSFSKSGRFMVFDQIFKANAFESTSEVSVLDLKTRDVVAQSMGWRIRDPSIHPNGNQILLVQVYDGRNRLLLASSDFQNSLVLYDRFGYSRVSNPKFNHDGSKIVMNVHNDETGGEDIVLLTEKGITPIVANSSLNLNPTWLGGEDKIIFSSDSYNGVFNLFNYDLQSAQLVRLTNVVGGLFFPVYSKLHRKIFVIEYHKNGFDVGYIPLSELRPLKLNSKLALTSTQFSYGTKLELNANEVPSNNSSKIADYQPWLYLSPQYVTPSISVLPNTFQLGFNLGAVDPYYFNHYELSLRYDQSSGLPVGRLYYYDGSQSSSWDFSFDWQAQKVYDVTTDQFAIVRRRTAELSLVSSLENWSEGLNSKFSLLYKSREKQLQNQAVGVGIEVFSSSEFTQLGLSFPEMGSYWQLGLKSFFEEGRLNQRTDTVEAKWRGHLNYFDRLTTHFEVAAKQNLKLVGDSSKFGAGGIYSFPIEYQSDLVIYGYPVNNYLSDRAILLTHRLTDELANLDQFIGNGLPSFFDRASIGFLMQTGAIEQIGRTEIPTSLGIELYQDLIFAHLFKMSASLGVYLGNQSNGGQTQGVFSLNHVF